MRRKSIILWVVVAGIVAAVGVSFAYGFIFPAKEVGDTQVSTMTVQRGDITTTVSATGFLSAQASLDLITHKSGTVKEILVEEGRFVKKGAVLVRLEDDEEHLSLLRTENALQEALLELESARVSQSSPSDIQNKERNVAELHLELELRKEELENTVLTAPFSGIISKVYVEEGELALGANVSASEPILRLVDTSRLFAEVNVDEVDIAGVQVGQKVNITVDAYLDKIFPGKVVSISPEATAISGLVVIEVKIELEEADPKLKPGFTASADIIVGEAKNVILLPVEQVLERDGKYFVTVLQDEKPTPRVVKVGISDGTSVEITGGLQDGEVIVAGGLQSLIEMRRKQKAGENTRSPGGGMHRLAP